MSPVSRGREDDRDDDGSERDGFIRPMPSVLPRTRHARIARCAAVGPASIFEAKEASVHAAIQSEDRVRLPEPEDGIARERATERAIAAIGEASP